MDSIFSQIISAVRRIRVWWRLRSLRVTSWWRQNNRRYGVWWRLGNGLAAVLLLVSVVIPIVQQVARSNSYLLSAEALQLVGSTDQTLAKQLSFDARTNTYQFNKAAIKSGDTNPLAALQSQVGTASGQGKDKGLYALDVPARFAQGVTYHDVNSDLSFSLKPQFSAADGKAVSGHLVFPLRGGNQAVYTLKNNGLKEDIVVPKAAADTMSFSYSLSLPKTLEARAIPDGNGAIGVYSADPTLFGNISYGSDSDRAAVEKARQNSPKNTLVFGLPSPVVKTPDGQQAGSARFELHGTTLTVVATNLSAIHGAFTVDPSVVVTSTSDFQVGGNAEDNISFATAGKVTRGGLTGGSVSGGWSTATTSGAFTTTRSGLASVAYGGYLYIVGGYTSTGSNQNDVQYAAIGSNGTLGSWSTTSSFANGRGGLAALAYNGYLYALGGYDGSTNYNSVQYAPINSNGTLGSWNATTSFTTGRRSPVAAVYNGYVYLAGGQNGTNYYDDVQYAAVKADGTLGTWATTSSFTTSRYAPGMVAYNGYLYLLGGYNSTNGLLGDVQYAPINSNGTLGSWATTTSLSSARDSFGVAVYNGYLYIVGGYTGSYVTTVQYAAINANGTIGAWATTASFTTGRYGLTAAAYNGYLYLAGGTNDTNYYNDTQYAKIDAAGQIGAWQSGFSMGTTNKRALSCAVAYNGYLYSLGGSSDDSNANNVAKVLGATIASDGTLGSWTSSGMTALPTVNSQVGRGAMGCVAANNKLYVIGGNAGLGGTNDGAVLYATIASSGNIGAWTTSSNSIASVNVAYTPSHNGAFIYDGYIYSVGGDHSSGSGADHNQGVYYAPLNSDGSVGTWAATSSLTGNYSTRAYGLVGHYLYAMGGIVSGGASNTAAVEYAPINSDGTVGTWNTTTSLPTAFADTQGVTINGCLYLAGGETAAGTVLGNTYYACPTSNGTISAWQTAPALAAATTDMAMAAYGGWLYGAGGSTSAVVATVEYAAVNNGGSGMAGTFSTTSSVLGSGQEGIVVVASGGYLYAMGGSNGTTYTADTYYAPFNANGTLGSWSATSGLQLARRYASAVAYNGYVYIFGGDVGSPGTVTTSKETEAAPINANGTLGSWSVGNDMPTALYAFGAATWNGRVYLTGGNPGGATDAVSYASLSSGTIGSWNTGTSFTTARYAHATVAYNGYLYVIGGTTSSNSLLGDVQYAPINSDGTVGTWTMTAGIPARRFLTATVANGFLYVFGGTDTSSNSKSDVLVAAIGNNGTLGAWSNAGSLNTARFGAAAAYYGGYLYVLGGRTIDTYDASLEYAPISAQARVGHYSKLIDLGSTMGLTSIVVNGTLPTGAAAVSYRAAGADAVFGATTPAGNLASATTCSAPARYVWVSIVLDDSTGQGTDGIFPDQSGTSANLTDFTINYNTLHPQPNVRLRNGMTLQSGSLSVLDTCQS